MGKQKAKGKVIDKVTGKTRGGDGMMIQTERDDFFFSSGFKMFIIDTEINRRRQDVLQAIGIGGTQLL